MADQRILQGVAATLSFTNVDQDGVAAAASGAVTVGVTRSDGTVVLAAGTATLGTNPYTRALTAAQTAALDVLTATWTDAGDGSVHTTTAEIVGGYYVTIAELRALANLSDTVKHTDAELVAARQWFEDAFERFTGVAWVPRYARLTLSGAGTESLLLPVQKVRTVRSVRAYTAAATYTSYTAGDLADLGFEDWGSLHRLYGGVFDAGDRNLVIELEHGYDEPPTDVKEAALVAIRDKVLGDQSGRVYAVQTEAGIVRSSLPGEETPFGIPFVDQVARARSHRAPAVA